MNGYENFVVLNIKNTTGPDNSIKIMNGNLKYGKFHDNEDKNYDIQPHYMNNITVPPHCEVGISACGKLGSMDGTEGSIELYDGQTKIFKLFWSDPFVGGNDFQIQEIDGRYHIDVHPWNHDDGALGRVNVEVFKRG